MDYVFEARRFCLPRRPFHKAWKLDSHQITISPNLYFLCIYVYSLCIYTPFAFILSLRLYSLCIYPLHKLTLALNLYLLCRITSREAKISGEFERPRYFTWTYFPAQAKTYFECRAIKGKYVKQVLCVCVRILLNMFNNQENLNNFSNRSNHLVLE